MTDTAGASGVALRAVVACGLPGAAPWSWSSPMADRVFDDLVDRTAEHGLIGVLAQAAADETVPVTPEQYRRLGDRHDLAVSGDLVLDRLLRSTSVALHREGIEHRALKGPAVARLDYPDPAMRSFGDVDILVPGPRFDATVALLVDAGGDPRYLEPRRGFTARFGKGVSVVMPGGAEVDVHRVLSPGPFGLAIDPDDLFRTHRSIVLGDVEVPALEDRLRFLHACYHAVLGGQLTRLSALRDVAQMALDGSVDFAAVVEVAERWRGRAVVARALRRVDDELPVVVAGEVFDWARRYRPDRFERTAMRAYAPDAQGYATQAAAGVWALRGVRDRIEYAAALLFPSTDYLADRDASYVRRVRRGLSLVRRGRA